eukprot:GHRR01000552.1.p1 GENE.GHRR01000552.1~~GHRR01000552.1.p1  ORF type:complete len:481 (+),score=157.91 GHRR01000552.1:293-1735(+)
MAPHLNESSEQQGMLSGWFSSFKPNGHQRKSTPDTDKLDQWQQHSDCDSPRQSLWSPDVAAAMGYGKNGRAGSAYQWWIPVLSAIVAIGGFIAWCVFVFRARDATDAAINAAGLNLTWWDIMKSVLLATAICYPIFTVLGLAVSLWRAYLARQLNIHAPDGRWMKRSRAWQMANVVSSMLLYGMFILLVVSIAAHAVWAYTARAVHVGSYYAIRYVDPVWSGVANVANASEGLVNNFVGLTQQLPVVGRRRLTELAPATGQPYFTRQLTEADVVVMPQEVITAGLNAARSLQQLQDLTGTLGNILNSAAGAINGVQVPQIDASQWRNIPGLNNILPNGPDNPLFQTLSGLTTAVQQQVLNRTGCALWCVDLRDQSWIRDGCICNLQRVKDAYPYLGEIFNNAIPAMGLAFAMMVGATWLLLHAASQWARTRSEAKLLARIPNAAQIAARQQQAAGLHGAPASAPAGAVFSKEHSKPLANV